MLAPISLREARAADVESIAALATLVFLDTYAPDGLRPDLAREAFAVYSVEAFAARLADERTIFILAQSDVHVVAFGELARDRPGPVAIAGHVEVVRLYVHPRFQQRGIGKSLLRRAEHYAQSSGSVGIWLSAWVGNTRALAFYDALGYKIAGRMDHVIERTAYENHILAKHFPSTTVAQ